MIVYDVIEHVKPGTLTSSLPGTWLIDFFATETAATEFAERCNQYRLVDGITYAVHAIDEESPDRHQSEANFRRSQR